MHQVPIINTGGIIGWFARNHVAANLLMFFIIGVGIFSSFTIRQQTIPDFDLRYVNVRVPYLGAAPQEVEEGVVIKIEEAIQDVKGILKVTSSSSEGFGSVRAEISVDQDLNEVTNEIKTRVDAISTFPELTEKPVIYKLDPRITILFVSIYGDLDEFQRKEFAQDIRDDLMALPSINQVGLLGDRPYEISVEVSEDTLKRYGLTMTEVSQAIKASSIDLPGGRIRSEGGDILLRTKGQVYTGEEFGQIVLRTYPDGTRLTLDDIANIDDGFVESQMWGRFNGNDTLDMEILAGATENEIETANAVKEYIAKRSQSLPPGVHMDVWGDRSEYLQDRLDLMNKNMLQGAALVFIVLSLFLRMKVAVWVVVGIPVAFLGALSLMPYGPWPVTINMISLFGFIMVLGIVVDDAIIIGESIYTKIRADGHTLENVILGAKKVALPATFGVLTTIAAFAPMLFITGFAGPFFKAMSVVVVLCLIFSIVESKLILPAHLAQATIKPINEAVIYSPYAGIPWYKRPARFFQRINRNIQGKLQSLIQNYYKPLLRRAINNRGLTVTVFISALILIFGVLNSGFTRIVMFPEVPGDYVVVELTMTNGIPAHTRDLTIGKIEKAALASSTPFPQSYLDWRDIDWKDPFVRNEVLKAVASSKVPTNSDVSADVTIEIEKVFLVAESDSTMRLELKMPSSTSIITSDSFDDLEDPFASKSPAHETLDPFEDYNRFMFDFNEGFYDNIMEPVVLGYRDFVNEDIRVGIANIFDNAMAPLKLVSSFLQGDIDKTGRVISRTIINTTLGLGGMFDVADKAFDIKDVNEDLDQVLGVYGVPAGPYIVLPLFGPSSVRNIFGRAGGMFLSPTYHFAPGVEVGGALTVTDQINDTSFIVDDIAQMDDSTIDKYESVRDFYGQYREVLVNK